MHAYFLSWILLRQRYRTAWQRLSLFPLIFIFGVDVGLIWNVEGEVYFFDAFEILQARYIYSYESPLGKIKQSCVEELP